MEGNARKIVIAFILPALSLSHAVQAAQYTCKLNSSVRDPLSRRLRAADAFGRKPGGKNKNQQPPPKPKQQTLPNKNEKEGEKEKCSSSFFSFWQQSQRVSGKGSTETGTRLTRPTPSCIKDEAGGDGRDVGPLCSAPPPTHAPFESCRTGGSPSTSCANLC